MKTESDFDDETPGGVSRRSLVRVGTTAAWTVPLIQIVGAAPALAVSGPAKLRIDGYKVLLGLPQKRIVVCLDGVKNIGNSKSGQVILVINIPKARTGAFSKVIQKSGATPTGWSFISRTVVPGGTQFTFISKAKVPAGGRTPRFSQTLSLQSKKPSGPLRVTTTAFANGVPAASASAWIS